MQKKKILVVDDEQNILKALKRELHNFCLEENLEILTATNATGGFEFLTQYKNQIAIIISDQKMPGITGCEFLKKVREKYPEIISIILSGQSSINNITQYFKADIFAFILKPWDSNQLLMEIKNALQFYHIKGEKIKYENMIKKELKWASELQKKLLKPKIPESDKITFQITYQPLEELKCGGDYYDIIYLEKDKYIILLGDVSGHGLKAAFITTMLKSIIYQEYIRIYHDNFQPADFLKWLNSRIILELEDIPEMHISFLSYYIDLNKKTLIYANAGHVAGYLIQNKNLEELILDGTSLGFSEPNNYKQKQIQINKNDKIIILTDGLIDDQSEKTMQIKMKFNKLLLNLDTNNDYHNYIFDNMKSLMKNEKFSDDVCLITIDINK